MIPHDTVGQALPGGCSTDLQRPASELWLPHQQEGVVTHIRANHLWDGLQPDGCTGMDHRRQGEKGLEPVL